MESSTQMTTFKNELASLFTSKLESFINELCAKHGMTPENIMNDWKDFSIKKETIDTKKNCECPNMTDLKEKCRMYKLKVGGKKNELVERIRAYEAGELVCDSLSIKDLKEKLRAKNLKVSGTKDELIKRLSESGSESGSESESESESVGNKSNTNIKTPYNKMKLMELRIELKTRGLKSSGKKDELIKRLMDDNKECESLSYGREEKDEKDEEKDSEVETEDDYVKMSEEELKMELKGRALSRKGTKEQMIKRLMDDDNFGSDSECESECESSDSECESSDSECGDS